MEGRGAENVLSALLLHMPKRCNQEEMLEVAFACHTIHAAQTKQRGPLLGIIPHHTRSLRPALLNTQPPPRSCTCVIGFIPACTEPTHLLSTCVIKWQKELLKDVRFLQFTT